MSASLRAIAVAALVVLAALLLFHHEVQRASNMSLIAAAIDGDIGKAQKAIADGADVNARDEDGYTALVFALHQHHFATAKYLVSAGSRLDIWTASATGDCASLEKCITRDENVNEQDTAFKYTPLMWAAWCGQASTASILIAHGADVEAVCPESFGENALGLAAEWGYADVVRVLLKSGSNPNVMYRSGATALVAAVPMSYDVVELLIRNGADPNLAGMRGVTPLDGAAGKGDKKMAALLIKAGARLDAQDAYGYTALCHAVRWGHDEVARYLIHLGAKVDLHVASGMGDTDEMLRLIRNGAALDGKDGLGCTALHWAAEAGRVGAEELLIAHGANINARSRGGFTPLHLALYGQGGMNFGYPDDAPDDLQPTNQANEQAARLLILKGADLSAIDNGSRFAPLALAKKRGYRSLVQLMVGRGAK